ncbi:MAG: Rho termination factor N-terminal domain-containing protein, partial [Actinomycetota bacterium]|nr:Rho termination factor N-terminal domain-containing protein [Actinomycetota bacterium]
MSVLDRDSLEASPLADLYVIATELAMDGHRRLRKAELVDAILARQGAEDGPPADTATRDGDAGAGEPEERPARSRSRRGGRGRG